MGTMRKIGDFATPYGVSIAAYADPADPQGCAFALDGTMTLAGIHGLAARERARTALKAASPGRIPDLLLDLGGRPVPRVALPVPGRQVRPDIPREIRAPLDAWVGALLDIRTWPVRARTLIDILTTQLEQSEGWAVPAEILALSVQQLLTATLEHLGEHELEDLGQAAFYALSNHPAWSDAAVGWLAPFEKTWFADWRDARPTYRRFAALCRKVDPDLPAWIAGDAA